MKKKSKSDLAVLFILIPVLLFCALYISKTTNSFLPNFSVINKSNAGCSVFFEALKRSHYPVYRTLAPISYDSNNCVQVIVSCEAFDINSSIIKDWVEKGGILVYLNNGTDLFPSAVRAQAPSTTRNIALYRLKKGTIITAEVSNLTNETLRKDTGTAYLLLKQIAMFSFNKIYFNEAYMFSSTETQSLWGYIPVELKLVIYQLVLFLLAFIYYKGKRFGKVIPLYDEVERMENEYLYSVASLYRQAKCWDLMFDNYYGNFLNQINHRDANWLAWWEKESLPSLDKALKVYEFTNKEQSKMDKSDYISTVKLIEELTNILLIRRERNWKILKKQ